MPLTYKTPTKILLTSGGRASTNITFNKVIQELQVEVSVGECECIREDDFVWNLRFEKLMGDSVTLKIIADNKILPQTVEFSVKAKGIQENSMGI